MLVDIGRKLFLTGLALSVSIVVFTALFAVVGIPLTEGVGAELTRNLSLSMIVSGIMSLVGMARSWGRLIPIDLMRGVLGVTASVFLSSIASTGILVPLGVLIDVAGVLQPPPVVSILVSLKSVLTALIPTLISLYTVQRLLGVPFE